VNIYKYIWKEARRRRWGGGSIQIWLPNTVKAISSDISILNGGLTPGRY